MIGKFVYKLLTDNISELSAGGVYPVINPQDPGTDYPRIIYSCFTTFEKSKDQFPNQRKTSLSLKIKGESYDQVNLLSEKVRDLLDSFTDSQSTGQDGLPSYPDNDGYTHNIIDNIDFDKIIFDRSEDYYDEDLLLYSKIDTYNVLWYDDILRLCYDDKTTTPLFFHLDFGLKYLGTYWNSPPLSSGNTVAWVYNRVIRPTLAFDGATPTVWGGKWESAYGNNPAFDYRPIWNHATPTLPAKITFGDDDILGIEDPTGYGSGQFEIPYGGLFIIVYKPTGTEDYNYLNGTPENGNAKQILVSHSKIGSDIKIEVNFNDDFTDISASNTLLSETDSTKYWDADVHFLALSFGGIPSKIGGAYTGRGWYEYFNSDYNPNKTTGQIENSMISGTTDSISGGIGWGNIGKYGGAFSAGFDIYETMGFVATEKRSDANDNAITPFSPGGIIYNQAKNYILNKYKLLK
jgi:hypothetical protein